MRIAHIMSSEKVALASLLLMLVAVPVHSDPTIARAEDYQVLVESIVHDAKTFLGVLPFVIDLSVYTGKEQPWLEIPTTFPTVRILSSAKDVGSCSPVGPPELLCAGTSDCAFPADARRYSYICFGSLPAIGDDLRTPGGPLTLHRYARVDATIAPRDLFPRFFLNPREAAVAAGLSGKKLDNYLLRTGRRTYDRTVARVACVWNPSTPFGDPPDECSMLADEHDDPWQVLEE